MAKRVSAAEAKAQLSTLMARVAYSGERFVIERRGKPMAALVAVAELERLEEVQPATARPLGALALAGAWREVADEELDSLLAEIYTERDRDTRRAVDLEY